MKNIILVLLTIVCITNVFTQEVGYNVFGISTNPFSGPYSLMTLDTLEGAQTIKDIYGRYRSDWVSTYIQVEFISSCGDVLRRASGKSDVLTFEQRHLLEAADENCRIDLVVDYIPENTLAYNPPRKMNFSLRVMPIFEAKYPGGLKNLNNYLKEHIVDNIPDPVLAQIALAKVRFSIDEQGQVTDARIYKTSDDKRTDRIMLEAICNMPKWMPAKNAEGKNILQEFEFRIGTDLLRCDYTY